MESDRNIEDIISQFRQAKEKNRGCTLLIGAGCSASAGIPDAGEIVELIKANKNYRGAYDRAEIKDYPHCMKELSPGARHDLIMECVSDKKINWAHMCIALLIQHDFVDRVLTVNFDPLISRACALLGEFPAIYDFAASKEFDSDKIFGKAVFHLHGQHTGFVHLHLPEEVEGNMDAIAPVFDEATRNRTWVVVGYSGECDPAFKHLEKVKVFNRELFWIGHGEKEPPEHVREGLLAKGNGAHYIKGYDADSFFIKLTQGLGIFPPKFVNQPFTHLQNTFEKLNELILPGQSVDITHTRSNIQKAIKKYETGDEEKLLAKAHGLLMAGDYEKLIGFYNEQNPTSQTQLTDPLAWAYIGLGIAFSEQALTKTGEAADKLFALAGEKYQQALKIKPEDHGTLFNMACLAALTGDAKGCREWLEKRIAMGTLMTRESMADSDFDSVRELGWFKNLLAKLEEG